jgi:DNA-directed RNA polymerase subunit RPC12/RpoP
VENIPAARQHAFPCQQCGAQLDFQPGTTELGCEHCGHSHQITVSHEPIYEYDFHSTLKDLPGGAEEKVALTVKCQACSAETKFDSNIHADACPFCGARIIADTKEHRVIHPKSILPFKITSSQATESYRRWLSKRWFAPNKLKKHARKDRKLNGVYVPYWTYDCHTLTYYRGQRGDIYQVPRQVSVMVNGRRTTRTKMVTKIRWTPASGSTRRSFDDVLIYATDSLPRDFARELAPWDLGELTPYQEEFLSGFQSEIYKTRLDQGFDYAKQRMHPVIRQDIRAEIGGDQQRISAVDTQYSKIRFKHILLPFWVAGFRYRDKVYQFIVNGRTGEVQGDRPYSWIKIGLAVLFAAIILATLGYFGAQSEQVKSLDFGDIIMSLGQF